MRLSGLMALTVTSLFFCSVIALGAMVRQREAFARSQKLAFELERSELERQALDARMRLLQAQVQPHFLFPLLQSRAFPHVAEQDLVGEFNQLGGEVADQPLRA
jgi:hypothetical protein